LWLLDQDFPIDSSALQKAIPEERGNIVEMIQKLYNRPPVEVCKALMDRKCEINDVDCISLLIKLSGVTPGVKKELTMYATERGYSLWAHFYTENIINTFFTVPKIQLLTHSNIYGLNQLGEALIKFKALAQLKELRTGKHKGLSLDIFYPDQCVKHLASQDEWDEGALFFLEVLGEGILDIT
jgi:hypothetical protein